MTIKKYPIYSECAFAFPLGTPLIRLRLDPRLPNSV